MEFEVIIILAVAYVLAGFIDSVAGGGGLVALPAILLTGIPPEVAMGTNKMISSIGMSASLFNYARAKLIQSSRMLFFGVVATLIGGLCGGMTLHLFDSETIGKIIVVLLPFGMVATLMPRKRVREASELTPFAMYVTLPSLLFVLGFYEGFFGPGSGSFLILLLHFALGIGFVQSSAMAKVFNVAGTFSGLLVFLWHGNVLFSVVLPLAFASIVGNVIGSRLAIYVGQKLVRGMLFFSLTLLLLSLVWKFYIS